MRPIYERKESPTKAAFGFGNAAESLLVVRFGKHSSADLAGIATLGGSVGGLTAR